MADAVLVTGGAGFIGAPLARRLADRGDRVVTFDREPARHADIPHIVGDITSRAEVRELIERVSPAAIVHTAAVVGVAASVGAGLMPTVQVNIAGSVNLFEAVLEHGGVRRILDLSSEEYYGDFAEEPLPENAPAAPISPYGISKFAVERLGRYYAEVRGLPYAAVRLSWVFGPDFPRARLPETWLRDAAEGRTSALARGGDQRIDFTYLADVVEGILAVLDAPALEHRAYNLASGTGTSMRELAEAIRRIAPEWDVELGDGGLELAPGVRAARKGAYDISRIRALGYEPSYGLEDALRDRLAGIREERTDA